MSIYPLQEAYSETLSPEQTLLFNKLITTINKHLELSQVDSSLVDLEYDGNTLPLPFPDAHWDLVACWFIIDGSFPPPIKLTNNETLDYTAIMLRDTARLEYWRKKITYARSGFHYR